MTSPLTRSIGQQLTDLAADIRQEFRPDSPDGLFALHVFEAAMVTGPVTGWPAPPMPDILRSGPAPALATAGYILTHKNATRPTEIVDDWREGLKRLSSKNAFPADRQTFAYRPLELYGLCLGASHLLPPDSSEYQWLQETLRRLESKIDLYTWAGILGWFSAASLSVGWAGGGPVPTADQPLDESALLRWLVSVHPALAPKRYDPVSADAALLERAILGTLAVSDVARGAVTYQAIRQAVHTRLESDLEATWQVGRPAQDAVALVTRLCRQFPLFASQMQVRHGQRRTIKFNDEYDVQDAMHALLRLFFDDVRAEEVTPSYAGNSSRIDFLLKREKVVVEIKMTRQNLKQREVASQLIEDKERYRTHPDFHTLVCFVYDPGGHMNNPTAVEDDVSQQTDTFRVVVVVSPKGI